MHIIPRRKDDYEDNDDIYVDLDEKNQYHQYNRPKGADNEDREPRSATDMAEEADRLRLLF
jgi:bis(5'-adenosyl)-triphosphatase